MNQTEDRIDINSVATPEYQEIAVMRQLCSEPECRPPLTHPEGIGDFFVVVLIVTIIAMFSCDVGGGGGGSYRLKKDKD